jgi:8-oxo-dGTP diphosphatase
MQRVTNCILNRDGNVLMLQKPRRGWWTAPGGKMEPQESIQETVIREYEEETGLRLLDPELKGVFTIIIEDNGAVVNEWMMFTFLASRAAGNTLKQCEEGILQWHPVGLLGNLPTAKGDKRFLTSIANGSPLITGKFIYTSEYELLYVDMDKG